MGSRLRDDVSQAFICFCEVVRPETEDSEPWIIQTFPESFKDEQVLKSVPKFCYPCEFENSAIQHYSFVFTNLDSKWSFGYCRHDPKTETAIVFLSYLPWQEMFVKLLNVVADLLHHAKTEELWSFLELVYKQKVPDPGFSVAVPYKNNSCEFIIQAPPQFQLPSIPENRNLTEYYSAVDAHNMLVIFASMLNERRIIFTSRKLYRLSSCVQAANAIIYPMHWQHIFIPVLPQHLVDYLLAPMPFLIGVPTQIYRKVRKQDIGEVVILDADNNTVDTPFDDLECLPQDVVKQVKSSLKNKTLGDGVSRTFLRALVQLIGGYRDALKFHQGQDITFSKESFIETRPPNMQPFLRKMLQLQIFQQFIEERLDILNAGLGFSDEFELEACSYSDKSSSKFKAQYKEWTSTMRTQGSAFFKTVRNKANPAMKSAVKSVKETGKEVKTTFKGFKSRMKKESQQTSWEYPLDHKSQPQSAPSSPTTHRARPMTFGGRETKKQRRANAPVNRSKEYSPLSPSSDEPNSPKPDLLLPNLDSKAGSLAFQPPPALNMDLMCDLQDVIFRKCSLFDETESPSPPVDRSLKPVRSLDTISHQELAATIPSHPPLFNTKYNQLRTQHPNALRSSFSLPLQNKPTPANPLQTDPFGFSDHLTAPHSQPLNHHPLHRPLISTAHEYRKPDAGSNGDLIALDCITTQDAFDPLANRNTNNDAIKFPTGLMNPLYPYYNIKSNTNNLGQVIKNNALPINRSVSSNFKNVTNVATNSINQAQKNYKPNDVYLSYENHLLPNSSINNGISPQNKVVSNLPNDVYQSYENHLLPNASTTKYPNNNHVKQGYNAHDLELLKDYGIEFNTSTSNTTDTSNKTTKKGNWTTFD